MIEVWIKPNPEKLTDKLELVFQLLEFSLDYWTKGLNQPISAEFSIVDSILRGPEFDSKSRLVIFIIIIFILHMHTPKLKQTSPQKKEKKSRKEFDSQSGLALLLQDSHSKS